MSKIYYVPAFLSCTKKNPGYVIEISSWADNMKNTETATIQQRAEADEVTKQGWTRSHNYYNTLLNV